MEITGKCLVIGEGLKPTRLSQLHPLLFPPVLNKVFNHLSLFHQKKCRLVCKTWDSELHPFLRQNCKVNLTNLVTSLSEEVEETRDEYPNLIQGISNICTSYVIEEDPIILPTLIQQLLPIPFQIKYLEVKNNKWSLSQIKNSILRILPHLEELRLPVSCSSEDNQHCHKTIHSTHTNRYISKSKSTNNWKNSSEKIPFYQETFSKLRSIIITLTIKDLQFFDYKDAIAHPILKLLQCSPNLEEFYYPNIVQFTSPYENPARILLENIIGNDFQRLSSLKIDTFVSNTDLKLLTAKKFPFKSLQLTITPDIYCRYLYDFLTCVKNTLKSLTLTFRDGFKLISKFPIMPELENMGIILWNGSLDFVEEIVQMKVLIVVLMEIQDEDILTQIKTKDFSENSNLQELEIHANREAKVEVVQKLVRMMPQMSLKKLTLDWVNDALLQNIYKVLPNLQDFVVLYGGFTESGITGVPPTFCREEYCLKESYALGLKRWLGISDLKRLKSLILTGELTDFMVVLGVCRCESLQRLELIARSTSKVGDASIIKIADVLSAKLEFLKLKNFVGRVNDNVWEYIGEKFNGREIHI